MQILECKYVMEIWLDSLWFVNKQTYFIVDMKVLICYGINGACFHTYSYTTLFVGFEIVRTYKQLYKNHKR